MSYLNENHDLTLNESSTDDLQSVIKRLEEVHLTTPGSPAKPVSEIPARIRDIVTKTISTHDGRKEASRLVEENHVLKGELLRVEERLMAIRADKSQDLKNAQFPLKRMDSTNSNSLIVEPYVQQINKLKQKIEDDHSNYKRKLQAYQDGQQRQADLIQKLQAKVLQYKQKNGEQESLLNEKLVEIDKLNALLQNTVSSSKAYEEKLRDFEDVQNDDLESSLIQLEEEKQRNASLQHVNDMLREQLEQATAANTQLTLEAQKLSVEWSKTCEELEHRENEEEKYFVEEHGKLLSLWNAINSFRSNFNEMKLETQKDLLQVKAEVSKSARTIQSASLSLEKSQRGLTSVNQNAFEEEQARREKAEGLLREKIQEAIELQADFGNLKQKLENFESEKAAAVLNIQNVVDEKERLIEALKKKLSQMGVEFAERSERWESDSQADLLAVNEEVEILQNTLRELSTCVLEDTNNTANILGLANEMNGETFDEHTSELAHSTPRRTVSPSRMARLRSKSPVRSRSPAFVESTVSSARSALKRRQTQIQGVKHHLDTLVVEKKGLTAQVQESTQKISRLEGEMEVVEEKYNSLKSTHETLNVELKKHKHQLQLCQGEKKTIQKAKVQLQEEIERSTIKIHELEQEKKDLKLHHENICEEKETVISAKDKALKDFKSLQAANTDLEAKQSLIKEELVELKEKLNRAVLSKEVLEQEKMHLMEVSKRTQQQKDEMEEEMNKLRSDEVQLKDALVKLQSLNEALGQDKLELSKVVLQVEIDRDALYKEKEELESDKSCLKEELLRTEKEKMGLETEKGSLVDSVLVVENIKEKLERQVQELICSKNELNDLLNTATREKELMRNDYSLLQQEHHRHNTNSTRLTKEKEDLTRENSRMSVQLKGSERECRTISESLASLKSEKDSLESSLYELQQLVSKLEARKEQLEVDNNKLVLAKDALNAELYRVRKDQENQVLKLQKDIESIEQQKEKHGRDQDVATNRTKQHHDEQLQTIKLETDKLVCKLKDDHMREASELKTELDSWRSKADRERLALMNEVAGVQKERDDLLLKAESDRQSQLRAVDNEKAVLTEKMGVMKEELEGLNELMEKEKRESGNKLAKGQELLSTALQELEVVKNNHQETVDLHEVKLNEMKGLLQDATRYKETLLQEIAACKLQVKRSDDSCHELRQDVKEANKRALESSQHVEDLERSCSEYKRLLKDNEMEKSAALASAVEFREVVKQAKGEKISLKKTLEDAQKSLTQLEESQECHLREMDELRLNIRELEEGRQDAKREVQQLINQVRTLENDCLKCRNNLNSAKAQHSKSERMLEEERQESKNLKQQVVENEFSCDALKRTVRELRNKITDQMEEFKLREKDLQMSLEDSRKNELKITEKMKNIENILEHLNQDKSDLKLKLLSAEGRNAGFESQLSKVEAQRADAEMKLSSFYSTLRRTLGIRPSQTPTSSPSVSATKGSPKKRSPFARNRGTFPESFESEDSVKDNSGNKLDTSSFEIDPEHVRVSLREFARKLKDAERERDEALANVKGLERQLASLDKDRVEYENRVGVLQKNLQETEEGKRGTDGRLSSAQTALLLQEETIRRLERERKMADEKLRTFEAGLAQGESEKRSLKEKCVKLQKVEAKYDQEREAMRGQIDGAESRITRLDLKKKSLEGDVERLRAQLHELGDEKQSTKQRADQLQRLCKELEQKNISLQLTVDRLNDSLAKSTAQEGTLKEKVTQLSVCLNQQHSSVEDYQEKLQQVERQAVNSEREKEQLIEKVEGMKAQQVESKKKTEAVNEKVLLLRNELAKAESVRIDLEGELRQSQQTVHKKQGCEEEMVEKVTKLQEEKRSLQDRLVQHQRLLSQAEQEKREMERSNIRIEKDKKALKSAMERSERDKQIVEDELIQIRSEKSDLDSSLSSHEQSLNSLRMQVSQLEETIEEKEQYHNKKIADMTSRHREELSRENERMKNSQQHLERTHASRERAHKQRTKGLEEQVNTLKDQLTKEMQQKQSFITRTTQKNDEIREIRQKLNSSINEVARNADVRVLDREAQRLDETVESFTEPISSTPFPRRSKSSPITRFATSDKYMTPTTDPGLTAVTRYAVPVTSEARRHIAPSFVSPIRRNKSAN